MTRADCESMATFLDEMAEDLQCAHEGSDYARADEFRDHLALLRAWAKMLREEK